MATIITSVNKLPRGIKNESVIADTETTGLDVMRDKPFMLALGIDNKEYAVKWTPTLVKWIEDNLPLAREVVCHFAKYDFHMFIQGGVKESVVREINPYCTMINEALIDEHQMAYNLDGLGKKHLGMGKDTEELYEILAKLFGGKPNKKQMQHISKAPIDLVAKYAIQDLKITRGLRDRQALLIEKEDLGRVSALEMQTINTLLEMERRGVPVIRENLEKSKKKIKKLIEDTEKEIKSITGFNVNVRSPKQMQQAFETLGLEIPINDKGSFTTAKDVLQSIDHPFAKHTLASRTYRQVRDAFIDGLEAYIYENGKIHTSFNQLKNEDYGTRSGRLSSSGPNLQQIPKRNPAMASIGRSIFGPQDKDHQWISADWSQFEFRVFAHYSGDKNVIQAYKDDPNSDFHQLVANETGLRRDPDAKQVNLGLIFGMGEGKLAKELRLPYTVEQMHGKSILIPGPEARLLFDQYHSRLPKIKSLLKRATALAQGRGYVKTLYGRRIRFPHKSFAYKAGGLIFQGSSADLMKAKLNEINKATRGKADLVLAVHDEYDLITPRDNVEGVKKIVKEIMEDIPELKIPIVAELGSGANWWEACK